MFKHWNRLLLLGCLWAPSPSFASFIESTIGTAVVNDATATYYNPSALTLLTHGQFIALGSVAYSSNSFNGQATQSITGYSQTGSSTEPTQYYLPSGYFGIPLKHHITLGFALVSDILNHDVAENAILRYEHAKSNIQSNDLVSAIGVQWNEYFSVGASLNVSFAHFLINHISGFPSLNILDAYSRSESSGNGLGGDVGFLLKPSDATHIGFNYRTPITYVLSGQSTLKGTPEIISNHFGFTFWTPARSTLSVSHYVTPKLGFIGTVQYIQWSIFKTIEEHGVALQTPSSPRIINTKHLYDFHDTYLITLGAQYWLKSNLIVRFAGSYTPSPDDLHDVFANGGGITVGASMGYTINKSLSVDASYSHEFISKENVDQMRGSNHIYGTNAGVLDAVSLKFIYNLG